MDVETLRALLMEIGNQQYHQVIDERRIVGQNNTVKPLFQRIEEVIGVWRADDYDKSGINYATDGGYDEETIFLGTSLSAGTEVVISYIVADGLNDITAQRVIDWARIEVLADLQDFTMDLDTPSSPEERIAKVYWEMLAMANAYLLLNNVNFVQSDANMALFNYQTMSKLWGEGMSTDALFVRLFQRLEQVRKACFMLLADADGFAYEDAIGIWQRDDIFKDWLGNLGKSAGIPSGSIWVVDE